MNLSALSRQSGNTEWSTFCALAYERAGRGSANSADAPIVLIVLRNAGGCLRLFVHPELRSMFKGIDLEYLDSLVLDFMGRSRTGPDELFHEISSIGIGPLFIHSCGKDLSEFPSLIEKCTKFIEL